MPDDERWTSGTWALFLAIYLLYGGFLWFVTGWGPDWLQSVWLCFRGTLERVPGGRGQAAASAVAFCLGFAVLMTPIVLTLVPTLGTLLWIMIRARRLKAERSHTTARSEKQDGPS